MVAYASQKGRNIMTAQNEFIPDPAPWDQHLVLDFNGYPREVISERKYPKLEQRAFGPY
tara:strand:+ start:88 stop:264 length:177 start_codon:yes stop_codon:yes gene_type:complete